MANFFHFEKQTNRPGKIILSENYFIFDSDKNCAAAKEGINSNETATFVPLRSITR